MRRFRLVLSEAVRSIGANLSTSFAATMTVLIGMFLLGVLVALGTHRHLDVGVEPIMRVIVARPLGFP